MDVVGSAGAAVGWKGDIEGTGKRDAGRRVFIEGTAKNKNRQKKVSAPRNRRWQWRVFVPPHEYMCGCMCVYV